MISTEKETQKAILQYLDIRGIFHYRQNSGAFKAAHGGFIRFGAKGAPDIVCVFKGQYIGIEVKDVKGKLNDNQKEFQKKLEEAGGEYLVARDVDDIVKYFEAELALKS